MARLLLLVAVLMLAAPAAAHADGIARGASALYDPTARLTLQDVLHAPNRLRPASRLPSFPEGNSPRVYWFRLTVRGDGSDLPRALTYTYKITRIDLYVARPGAPYEHVAAGFDLGREDGAVAPGVLPLPEAALEGNPVYLRVASVIDPASIRLTALRPAMIPLLQHRGIFAFFVGFFVAIGAFNLLMFARLRDRALLNYAGVMFLNALQTSTSYGVLWQILPPVTFLQRELIYDTIAIAGSMALVAFSLDFLRLMHGDRRSAIFVLAGTLPIFSIYVTDFFPSASLAFDWTLVVTLLYFASLVIAGARARRGGMRAATAFTAGIACNMAGFVINMSSYLLPRQDLWVYALDVGIACQAVLLGFAVAQNVQESRTAHERLLLESRQLERLASLDGLTGVLNRRTFDDALASADEHAFAQHEALGIIMIDIDWFKEYNDALGHQAGDDALRNVARACASCVRDGDVFARYGGEEFAAIVPAADVETLHEIAERMRAAVLELGLTHPLGRALSISAGGASARISTTTRASQVLRDADTALYSAKSAGRDRVVITSRGADTRGNDRYAFGDA